MKYIVLIIGLMVVGCGKTEEDKVVGTYERKKGEDTFTLIFLENGILEGVKANAKWKPVGKEVHVMKGNLEIVFEIESNDDLTEIAVIIGGKRLDTVRTTYKKIK